MLEILQKCIDLMDDKARRGLAYLFALILFASGLEALGVGIIFPFIKLVQDPSGTAGIPYLGTVLKTLDPKGEINLLILGSIVIFLLFAFKNAYLMLALYARIKYVQISRVRLAKRLLQGYVRGPYTLHLGKNSAEIIRNLNSSAIVVFSAAILAAVEIVLETMTAVAIFAMVLFVNISVTLSAMALLTAGFAVFFLILPRWMRQLGVETNRLNKSLIMNLQQCLGAIKEIKVLGREIYFENTYARATDADARIKVAVHSLQAAPRFIIEVALVGGMLVVVYVLTAQGETTEDLLAVLGVFALAAYRLLPSGNRILGAVNSINVARAAVNDVHRDFMDFATTEVARQRDTPTAPLPFDEALILEDVTFTYPGAPEAALTNIGLHIEKGQSVGIVGRSGAGKTTLVDVVLGILDPSAGRLLVDGQDIAVNPRGWQDKIGYVPQAIYLTDDTLRRNIAFGIEDDEIDDEQVYAALRGAYLHDFVDSLDKGLDTMVGENGVRFSGGQRQRVGIARALYHDPDVLVMDEATSAIDSETERKITQAINDMRGTKTILVIAHRLSTVRNCDNLIFLDHGRCVAAGNFDELMTNEASFRAMVQHGEIAGDATPMMEEPLPA